VLFKNQEQRADNQEQSNASVHFATGQGRRKR
jgi:hypothetical protein